jgi:Zn-dependent protease with chaperone function
MKARLAIASLFTMGVLVAFVAAILLIALYWGGMINGVMLIALTVFVSAVSWLISPFVQDLVLRWFYSCEQVDWPEFVRRWPGLAGVVEKTCKRAGIPVPAMRIIDDGNPTAYCFGSGAWNARLVATRGLFRYLDEDEVAAVYCHELGHIANGDFVVMTMAATLCTVLYELYVIFSRGKKGGDSRSRLVWVGYLSYIFYLIATYLVLYLSRTREYLADRFSAESTRNPNALAMGLVKVAYGIAAAPDSAKSKRLLASTRALGLYDYKVAGATGGAYARLFAGEGGVAVANGSAAQPKGSAPAVERVFLFDLFNPWAKIGELNSTHPLTGKRIRMLMEYCKEYGIGPRFDFSLVSYEGQMLDRGRLYKNFGLELVIYFGAYIGFALGLVAAAWAQTGPALFAPVLGLGLGWSLRGLYGFPGGKAEPTTVFELMCDPYASPVRGRLVYLEGAVVGRAQAGSPVGEDMMLQDTGGGLIALNYESWLPLLGNLWFGWRQVKKLIDQPCAAFGWFRRYTRAWVDLKRLNALTGSIESYTRFWGLYRGPLFIVIALLLMASVRFS